MEMLPPATSVVVGATIEKRFPGYGVHRGTVAEIDGGKVLVHWAATDERKNRRWHAGYRDADGKTRFIGLFDTQEAAARAYNAAIRRAGLEGKRRTNPVVDGQLVPRAYKARGHGVDALRGRKRRREEPAATPSARARRPRRD
ncbi:unnamed protein product [Pelagomonas calceolata]|uniref:AP2/ERF domain-containing protein n=1 Tax=Pelagomonas calceolata TaxID=35677 RepID=A0A8J2SYZ7_9STRA|nr:unnamed protein product [Pelagomonas calceolata]